MRKVVYITVLAKDVRNVSFIDVNNCAIARAVHRRFPQANLVGEGIDYCYVTVGETVHTYDHKFFGQKDFFHWQNKVSDENLADDVVLFKMRMTLK